MEILAVLFFLGMLFAIIICPIITLVKLSSISAKLNDVEYKLNILKALAHENKSVKAAPEPPPAPAPAPAAPAEPPAPAEPIDQKPPIPKAAVEKTQEITAAAAEAVPAPQQVRSAALDRLAEDQSSRISAKLSTLEERSKSIIKNIISWICVGEEYRSSGVSREYAAATTWLIRLGVMTLLCGIGFFLKYSIDRNWTPPPVRVVLMLLAGLAMAGAGAWKSRSKYRPLAIALSGAGFVTLYLSIMAAYKLYDLIPSLLAFGAMIAVTIAAIACALGTNAVLPALLGCMGGYLTPVFISTGSQNITLLFIYMTVLSGGTLLAAYYRNWVLLNLGSFIFYVIIGGAAVNSYINAGNALPVIALLAVNYIIFSLQQTAAAAKRDLSIVEIILTLGNLAFYFAAALPAANRYLSSMEMPALIALSTALITAGEIALVRYKFRTIPPVLTVFLEIKLCFGLIMTIPLLLGNIWVAAAWSVMALLIAESAIKLRSRTLLVISAVLYAATGLRELITRGVFAQEFDSYIQELLAHLLTAGVYVSCLTFSGIRLLRCSRRIADTDTAKPAATVSGKLAQIFLWLAGGLFFIYSSYELTSAIQHTAEGYFNRSGILIFYWSILIAVISCLIRKYSKFNLVLLPITLLILTAVMLLGFGKPHLIKGCFLPGLLYTVLTAGVYTVSLLLMAGECRKSANSEHYTAEQQKKFKSLAAFLYTLSGGIFFIFSTMEIYNFWKTLLPGFRNGGISVYWSFLAFILLVWGIKKQLKALRMCGIVLFLITAFKIFFVDLADLEQIWRIVAFAIIGVVMLIGAVVYIKFKDMFIKEDEVKK